MSELNIYSPRPVTSDGCEHRGCKNIMLSRMICKKDHGRPRRIKLRKGGENSDIKKIGNLRNEGPIVDARGAGKVPKLIVDDVYVGVGSVLVIKQKVDVQVAV